MKYKKGLKRRFNEGTLVDDHVPLKIYKGRKKRKKIEPPKTKWEKLLEWLKKVLKFQK